MARIIGMDSLEQKIEKAKENYEAEIQAEQQTVLLDFWAPWCGPCQSLFPVVDELAQELGGKVKIGKVNIDTELELARQFSVMSIPTLVVMKDGKKVSSSVGVQSKEDIEQMLQV